jgi:hypothetical protein
MTSVTGFEGCSRFGDGWDATKVPAVRFGVGLGVQRLDLSGMRFSGRSEHFDVSHSFTLDDEQLGAPTVSVPALELRLAVDLWGPLYVGATGSLGYSGSLGNEDVRSGGLTLSTDNVGQVGGAAVVGLAVPIGPFTVRGELHAGAAHTWISSTSVLEHCVVETNPSVTRGFLSARGSVAYFVTPWISLGVYGGGSFVGATQLDAGAMVTMHMRSFDGSF